MQMSFPAPPRTIAALLCFAAPLCGCSARQAPPATPVDTARTPTFRSSANSYDQPNTPLYTQPGVNHGVRMKLPSIATVDRFDQNAPLAEKVYGQLQAQLGQQQMRYVTVQSKGSTVQLGGTASVQSSVTQAAAIAKQTQGVATVENHIKVQAR